MAAAISATAQEGNSISTEVLSKCPFPSQDGVQIPNGRQATEQQMIDAQGRVKSYVNAGDTFLACLDDVQDGWGEAATDEQRSVIAIFHNKMVDEMQAVADLFNSSLSAYKARR